uniref:Uncharacterized protein n=1 Tax=Anguilla anguilla TaxID=7936 RepID=A0A0E9V0Z0_ANGAN
MWLVSHYHRKTVSLINISMCISGTIL